MPFWPQDRAAWGFGILNHLIYTPITITKTDITGAERLPGALIEVSGSDGNVIYREYTDENGELPRIPVVPGTYTFRETYAPSGYALNVAVKTFTVAADGKVTGETEIRDEVNRVMLEKTQDNGDVLPGAVFGLFDGEGTKIQEAVSDQNGLVVFSRIPYGTFSIREISAPHGYHPSDEEWTVTVDGTYVNPEKMLATVVNEPAPGRIRILKQDALDRHPIAGVQFDIFEVGADGKPGDLVASMTTDQNGIAESPALFSATYLVKEHANPTGYTGDLWSETFTLDMDEVVTRTVVNTPVQGRIRIVKTDSETGKGLPGAVFTVTRISGLPSHNGENDGEIVAVITSGQDGIAETPLLTWGEYEIAETSVPEGYLDDGYIGSHIPEDADDEEAVLPISREMKEGDVIMLPRAELAEGKTTPPSHHTEDTILHAMETAGAENMPEDAEHKGIGTPATRAAILEKLLETRLVERVGDHRKRVLIPTAKGKALASVLPAKLCSAQLTADWEHRLKRIEKGEEQAADFMEDIEAYVRDLTKGTSRTANADELFPPRRQKICACPRCGAPITDHPKGFMCENRVCGFVIWKNAGILKNAEQPLTASDVKTLVEKGAVRKNGLISAKSHIRYNATLHLGYSKNGRPILRPTFD